MSDICMVNDPDEKSRICDSVLRALPSWFGVETSIVDYVYRVREMPLWAAFDGNLPVGFLVLKAHNLYTSEICVMGVRKEYHRGGIGRRLIESCIAYCRESHTEYLTVKTLDESGNSVSYAKTRAFYGAMGFRPLEVFPLYWDEANPCLLMARYLPRGS